MIFANVLIGSENDAHRFLVPSITVGLASFGRTVMMGTGMMITPMRKMMMLLSSKKSASVICPPFCTLQAPRCAMFMPSKDKCWNLIESISNWVKLYGVLSCFLPNT